MTDPSSIAPDATPSSPAPRRARLRLFARFRRSEDGATAVEFALISVPFLALLVAILETALLFWTSQVLEEAVSETSRGCSPARP